MGSAVVFATPVTPSGWWLGRDLVNGSLSAPSSYAGIVHRFVKDRYRVRNPEVILFNASPYTSNLGVSALCRSTVEAISRRLPSLRISIATGPSRDGSVPVWDVPRPENVATLTYRAMTRRFWSTGSPARVRAGQFLTVLGGEFSRRFKNATAVLDMSGGDSFSDIYGPRAWAVNQAPKYLAMKSGKPLILLPQTIGPFADERVGSEARSIMEASALVCARDRQSFAMIPDLEGSSAGNHRLNGVDMAFLLNQREPAPPVRDMFMRLRAEAEVVVGLNISGLVWFTRKRLEQRGDKHAFVADYRRLMKEFVEAIASRPGHKVLLIPHVLAPEASFESDPAASKELLGDLASRHLDNVSILPLPFDEGQAKWVIARCDWFAGARMHPTIAGLSTGVPTLNLAYSKKASGVFETAGQEAAVADLRAGTNQEILNAMLSHFESRARHRDELNGKLPGIQEIANGQVDKICEVLEQL